jgi:hypothetical protein
VRAAPGLDVDARRAGHKILAGKFIGRLGSISGTLKHLLMKIKNLLFIRKHEEILSEVFSFFSNKNAAKTTLSYLKKVRNFIS